MREYIYTLLSEDGVLNGLGINAQSIYAGDIDTPVERPFLNLRWGIAPVSSPAKLSSGPRLLTVWVHDAPNDYSRIDAIVRRIKQLFAGVVGVRHEFGWVTCIEWEGDSEDGTDDGHGTITRNIDFTLIVSGQ